MIKLLLLGAGAWGFYQYHQLKTADTGLYTIQMRNADTGEHKYQYTNNWQIAQIIWRYHQFLGDVRCCVIQTSTGTILLDEGNVL